MDKAALRVVGGADERKEAQSLAEAFTQYHLAVHEIKQLNVQLVEVFESLERASSTLKQHDVRVAAEFEPPMQSALERWRSLRPRPEVALPAFIPEPPHPRV